MSSGAAASRSLPSQRKEDPWQQEPNKSHARKRFSYKSKSNRTPLRGKLRQAEAARLVEESEKEAKLRAKKLHGEKKNRGIDSVKELQTMTQTTAERTPDHILVRKSQLSDILLTLAKLEGSETNIQFDAENPSLLKLKLDTQQGNLVTDGKENQLESVLNLSKSVITGSDTPLAYQLKKSDNQTHHHASRTRPKGQAMEPDGKRGINQTSMKMMAENTVKLAHAPANEDKVFVRGPSKVVTIIGETIIGESNDVANCVDECSREAPSIESQSEEMLKHKQELTLSPRQTQLLLPRAHMTKAERKRLQWDLEKEAVTMFGKANESSMLSSMRSTIALQANELSDSSKGSSKLTVEMDKQTTNHQKQRASITSVVEPVYVPGLGQVDDQAIKYSDDNTNSAGAQYIQNQYNVMRHGPVQHIVPSKYPLSKAQIKRLQWEKEKDELVEYDPWGRAGVGVGPRCHRPGDNQIKGYKPLNFHPSQSERNTEPVIQLADYTGLNGSRNQPSIETPTGVLGLDNGTRESNKPDSESNLSLTKAQRLRLKWQQERESGIDEYNPYGKPGAGAPIRTESGSILTNYHDRQKQMMKQSIEYSDTKIAQQSDDTHLSSRSHQHSQHTAWVDQENTSNVSQPTDDLQTHDTDTDHSLGSHIRRRLVNLDPQTLKEREEQRKREKIYQDEIRHQVEENERLRREEKLRKVQEEAEEEAKLKAHRKNEIRQHETAAIRTNQSEIKEMSRADIVAESMQRARQEAEFLKAQKRLEKLKAAGHDISHLKATYEGVYYQVVVDNQHARHLSFDDVVTTV